ncbi:ankyrin repeat domain-containing protein 65-like [Anneissia japonica]|uniref:ankyrin repeat domain-containing protein 65-like n=1 Tax=Anneissia japonica TaxID=1529436 RepID=UPI00142560CE|nr:ankyrin repeat domain-containing protein 65-like [Anneissia japonica]
MGKGDWTPLMHALHRGAPDGVLENMIKTATVECLEKQSHYSGFTILHFLAAYARVSAMRRVLEKTNKKINTQDRIGRTPLHECLWNEKLTHEQHKEVAILNITFGASVTIKDKDGKTPLDLYDRNKCYGYEETTRSEKKLDLKELLEKLSTPSEILARGPDAVKAFKDALQN